MNEGFATSIRILVEKNSGEVCKMSDLKTIFNLLQTKFKINTKMENSKLVVVSGKAIFCKGYVDDSFEPPFPENGKKGRMFSISCMQNNQRIGLALKSYEYNSLLKIVIDAAKKIRILMNANEVSIVSVDDTKNILDIYKVNINSIVNEKWNFPDLKSMVLSFRKSKKYSIFSVAKCISKACRKYTKDSINEESSIALFLPEGWFFYENSNGSYNFISNHPYVPNNEIKRFIDEKMEMLRCEVQNELDISSK